MNLIETKDLCKKYGDKLVIDHVNMRVPEKAIYGFVGENGSGKTTIMRPVDFFRVKRHDKIPSTLHEDRAGVRSDLQMN